MNNLVKDAERESALRSNNGKPELSYILDAPNAIKGTCKVFEFGAKKYARNNWKKGFLVTEIIDSLLRHLLAFQNGEDCDAESGLYHVDHIMCNAIFLSENYYTHPDKDNRDKKIVTVKDTLWDTENGKDS